MEHIQNNNEAKQLYLTNQAKFYLETKHFYRNIVGKELRVNADDYYMQPKMAVITGIEVRVGVVDEGRNNIINSMDDFNNFDIVHEVVLIETFAVFNYKDEVSQIFFDSLIELNPVFFKHFEHK